MRRPLALLLMLGVLGQPVPVAAERLAARDVPGGGASQFTGQPDVWDSLAGMPRGTRCRLVLASGSEITGRRVSARADAIVLEKNEVRKGTFSPPSELSLKDPPITMPPPWNLPAAGRLASRDTYQLYDTIRMPWPS